MSGGQDAEQVASQAAEAVRRVIAEAEEKAAEIIREAESKAAKIREQAEAKAAASRERAEADARAQIEAAKRALDELGGTLAAAASAAIPGAESTPGEPDTQPERDAPAESPGAAEAPVSPPAPEPEQRATDQDASPAGNGDDAAERLLAMKLAVQGEDPAAIEATLVEKFGPGDRSALLKDVLARARR